MDVHYLNHDRFQKDDTLQAAEYAAKLKHKDKALNIVTFLVLSRLQYEPFLGEMDFTAKDYKSHLIPNKGGKIQIHTVKTYHPNYRFAGSKPSEILIAVGVPPTRLIRFEDMSNIAHCIIVPWLLDENREFLSIYEALDIETGKRYPKPAEVDERILKAIDWLKATSFPNEGYHHPNDSMRLHQMANALKKNHVPVDYAATVYCGMNNGLIPSAARQTADAFVRAQKRLFAVEKTTDYRFLKRMMEESHEQL